MHNQLCRRRKAAVRAAARVRRAAAHAAIHDAGEALRDRFLEQPGLVRAARGACFAGYWPVGSEIDPRPLMLALLAMGGTGALPVVTGRDRPLQFRRWRAGDPVTPAPGDPLRIPVPPAGAPVLRPRLLLVPMLAFDREGFRMGYGGGFYDRSLAALRATGPVLAVGLAYAGQCVAGTLPREPADAVLDRVVTESGGFTCPAGAGRT